MRWGRKEKLEFSLMDKLAISKSRFQIGGARGLAMKVVNSLSDYVSYIRALFLIRGNQFMFFNKSAYSSASTKLRSFTNRKLIFISRLYLKGIGYKFLRSKAFPKFIRVELGYSVFIYVSVPNAVRIFNKRNRIVVFGFDKKSVADFSMLFFQLREADVYKGKGVRFAIKDYSTFKSGKQRL